MCAAGGRTAAAAGAAAAGAHWARGPLPVAAAGRREEPEEDDPPERVRWAETRTGAGPAKSSFSLPLLLEERGELLPEPWPRTCPRRHH